MRKAIFPVSFLYTPGINNKNILKAIEANADVSVFDLEDSVPRTDKPKARNYLNNFISNYELNITKAVRVNAIKCTDGFEDILFFIKNKICPDIIIMTMVNSNDEIHILKDVLSENDIHSKIYVTVETPIALSNIQSIASCCDGLIFGSADLAAFLRVNISWDNMLYARQVIANAAAIYNISAIDTACYSLNNETILIEECRRVKELGFHGKAAIHPAQIKIINDIFYPAKSEIKLAERIIKKYQENMENIINLDGQMIGPPFVAKAKWILEKYGFKNDNQSS